MGKKKKRVLTPEERAAKDARKAAKKASKRARKAAQKASGEPKPLKKECCLKYKKKGKACSRCPVMAKLPEERQAVLLARGAARKAARKAAKKAKKQAKRDADG